MLVQYDIRSYCPVHAGLLALEQREVLVAEPAGAGGGWGACMYSEYIRDRKSKQYSIFNVYVETYSTYSANLSC